MSLQYLGAWAPFQIDALGIITLIGADEVDLAIGRLTSSYITDFLPVLGAYKVSANAITQPIQGFELYNITDGIFARDLTGWFSRWLLHQNIYEASSTIRIGLKQRPRRKSHLAPAVLGLLALGPLIILSVLLRDWWGFVNSLSMTTSVFVRRLVLRENELAIEKALQDSVNTLESLDSEHDPSDDMIVKAFLKTPSGDGVTVITSRRIVRDCLLTTPRPRSPAYYRSIRFIGWLAFSAQVISLGMSCLFLQIITVIVMCGCTVLVIRQVGSDEQHVGTRLHLVREEADENETGHRFAYARLDLSDDEEKSMIVWGLVPQPSNEKWWERYRRTREVLGISSQNGSMNH